MPGRRAARRSALSSRARFSSPFDSAATRTDLELGLARASGARSIEDQVGRDARGSRRRSAGREGRSRRDGRRCPDGAGPPSSGERTWTLRPAMLRDVLERRPTRARRAQTSAPAGEHGRHPPLRTRERAAGWMAVDAAVQPVEPAGVDRGRRSSDRAQTGIERAGGRLISRSADGEASLADPPLSPLVGGFRLTLRMNPPTTRHTRRALPGNQRTRGRPTPPHCKESVHDSADEPSARAERPPPTPSSPAGRPPRRRPRRDGRRSCRTPRSRPRACRTGPSRSGSRRPRG